MLDQLPQASQPGSIQASVCSYGGGHVCLSTGYICLSFSYEEFLQLAQVVQDIARVVHEQILTPEHHTKPLIQEEDSSLTLTRTDDPATRLASILCLLRTETDPARVAELRHVAGLLDEEVRQEVRQYARASRTRPEERGLRLC